MPEIESRARRLSSSRTPPNPSPLQIRDSARRQCRCGPGRRNARPRLRLHTRAAPYLVLEVRASFELRATVTCCLHLLVPRLAPLHEMRARYEPAPSHCWSTKLRAGLGERLLPVQVRAGDRKELRVSSRLVCPWACWYRGSFSVVRIRRVRVPQRYEVVRAEPQRVEYARGPDTEDGYASARTTQIGGVARCPQGYEFATSRATSRRPPLAERTCFCADTHTWILARGRPGTTSNAGARRGAERA
jgi:hypothetical protein